MTLNDLYENVCRDLEAGEYVPADLIANLQDEGYVFPDELFAPKDEEDEADDGEVSPNEVTVSFTDYTHDTLVDVTVDSEGDFWITTEGGALSPAGARRLLEILAEALEVYIEG